MCYFLIKNKKKIPGKVTTVHHCKKFVLYLYVLPKETLMLTKEVLLLLLFMFIKLHENIAATYQIKILSSNILSKK